MSRQPIAAAEEAFRGAARFSDPAGIPSDELVAALRDFASVEFDVADEPQADGFLFEYGAFRSLAEPAFVIGFTRQLSSGDTDGESEGYHQLHLEYPHPIDADLEAAGSRTEWWFRDDPVEFGEWLGSVMADPIWEKMRRKRPTAFTVFQEDVG